MAGLLCVYKKTLERNAPLCDRVFLHRTISIDEIIDNSYENISIHGTIRDMIKIVNESNKTVFAVHDDESLFVGILELNDIKKLILQKDIPEASSVSALVKHPSEVFYFKDSVTRLMKKFDDTNSWHLPVLNAENKFVGFISKSKLFAHYRKSLSENSDLYQDF